MPVVAAALRGSDITSRQAAQPTELGDGSPATIGLQCATLRLSIGETRLALGVPEP